MGGSVQAQESNEGQDMGFEEGLEEGLEVEATPDQTKPAEYIRAEQMSGKRLALDLALQSTAMVASCSASGLIVVVNFGLDTLPVGSLGGSLLASELGVHNPYDLWQEKGRIEAVGGSIVSAVFDVVAMATNLLLEGQFAGTAPGNDYTKIFQHVRQTYSSTFNAASNLFHETAACQTSARKWAADLWVIALTPGVVWPSDRGWDAQP